MPGKIIQISTVVTPSGVALYVLDDAGHVFEKLVGIDGSPWTLIR